MNNINNLYIELEKTIYIGMAMNCILFGPIIAATAQIFLCIREICFNSRKEYNSSQSEYQFLYYTSYAMMGLGFCMLFAGIIMITRLI